MARGLKIFIWIILSVLGGLLLMASNKDGSDKKN